MMEIIESLNKKTLLDLAGNECDACVSLYMPTVRSGPQTRQNYILFKDLCSAVAKKLEKYHVDSGVAALLMDPLNTLAEDYSFFEKRTDGLAIFVNTDKCMAYRSPVRFTPMEVVDKRFYIRPLLPLLSRAEVLNVVVLNRRNARLLKCSAEACAEKKPPRHLRSFENYLALHQIQPALQYQSNSSGRGVGSSAVPSYHGQGMPGDDAVWNRYLKGYYSHFKNWLVSAIDGTEPAYIFSDDRNMGVFLSAAAGETQKFIPLVRKNTHDMDDREVMDSVQAEIEHIARQKNIMEKSRFLMNEHDAETHTIRTPATIVAAAHEKRIDTLFLPDNDNQQVWGWFDKKESMAVLGRQAKNIVGEELLNLAAIRTMQNGGKVVVDSGNRESGTAAICRW